MGGSRYVAFGDCDKICRSCLNFKTSDLFPIEEVQHENIKLTDIFQIYLSVKPEENDKLPQKMCKNCIIRMFDTHAFLEKCKASETYLQDAYEIYNQNPGAIYLKVEDDEAEYLSETCERKKESDIDFLSYFTNREKRNSLESNQSNTSEVSDKKNGEVNLEEEIFNEAEYIFLSDTDYESATQVIVTKVENTDDVKNAESVQNYVVTPQEIMTKVESGDDVESFYNDDSTQESVTKFEISDNTELRDDKQKFDETIIDHKRLGVGKKCDECLENFEDFRALKLHWKIYDHYPERFRCSYCDRGFVNKHSLRVHVNVHTRENSYKCKICNRSFSHRANFQRHLLIHSDVKKYRCEECDKGFTRLEFLRNHERKLHGREKLLCTYCGKAFSDYNCFHQHEKEHAPNTWQCNKCGKIFTTERGLKKHREACGATKIEPKEFNPLACPHCDDTFPNKYATREHKLHSQCYEYLDKFPCNECGKMFFTPLTLSKHEWLHKAAKSGKTYECKTCDQTFTSALQLYKHNYRHKNLKKHVCDYCGKGFHSKSHLGYHLRHHTGEKPYVCEVCNKGFAIKGNLTAHMALHMSDRPTYQCEICDNVYVEKKGLRKHYKNVHDLEISV